MTDRNHPRRAARGFTLVELLVVIGIIALLISILLPTLSSARQSANQIACSSNIYQVSSGVNLYALDSEQSYPWSLIIKQASAVPPGQVQEHPWWIPVSLMLGVEPEVALTKIDPAGGTNTAPVGLSEIFFCSESQVGFDDFQGTPAHYTANERLMPFHNMTGDGTDKTNAYWHPASQTRKLVVAPPSLGSIRNAAEVAMAWDGPQILDWKGGSAWPRSASFDNWRVGYHGWFGHLLPQRELWGAWTVQNYDLPLALGFNEGPAARSKEGQERYNVDYSIARDGGYRAFWESNMRFRHKNNTSVPLVFADGHVEARTLGNVTARDISVEMAAQLGRDPEAN